MDFLQSKTSGRWIFGIGTLAIAIIIFQAGVFVGYQKATFSLRLGDNFSQTFGQRHNGFPPPMMMDPANDHGTAGKILSVNNATMIIADRDQIEKTVSFASSTDVKFLRDTVPTSYLKTGDFVVVIGSPNSNGNIQAQLIRIMPTVK